MALKNEKLKLCFEITGSGRFDFRWGKLFSILQKRPNKVV